MADYNINAVTRRVVFSGSAGTGPYAFTFEILDENDIAVYFNATLLTLTTDYTVSINANGTGSVTIVVGTNVPTTPDGDDSITIVGARDIERTTDFVTAGDFRASAINEQLDALTIFDQQISERVDRSIIAPVTDPTTIDMTLPAKADRLGKTLLFNSSTGNPEAGPTATEVTNAQTYANNASASADAAAADAATVAADKATVAADKATVAADKATTSGYKDAAATSASNAAASAAAAEVAKIEWQGTYNAGTAYALNDAVVYNGSSFICIQAGTGQTPAVGGTAYWDDLANKGTDGAGSGDLLAANNLDDLDDVAVARQNLGLEIGVDVLAPDGDGSGLTGISGTGANLIINGDMRIAHRGTSFATLTSGQYTLDRWNCVLSGGGAVTITQDADVPSGEGLEYSLKVDVTTADALGAAGDQYALSYTVEGYDAAVLGFGDSGAQNMTLSFWVKSPKTGQHTVAFQNEAQNRVYLGTYTVNVADTWEYKTITVAGDTTGTWTKTNGYGLTMYWALGMGSTNGGGTAGSWGTTQKKGSTGDVNVMDNVANDFFLSGCKLEIGNAATTFVPDDYATALAKCQRYYQVIHSGAVGNWRNASTCDLVYNYPVVMRTAPTFAIADTTPTVVEPGVASRTAGTCVGGTHEISATAACFYLDGFTGPTAQNFAALINAGVTAITLSAEL